MMTRRPPLGRKDRAKAAGAAIAVNLLVGVALVTGLAMTDERRREQILETFDVSLPPPPPPEAAEVQPAEDAAKEAEGAAGKKAEASPVVALPSPLPVPPPVTAAPKPANGSAASSGAAVSGTGPGAGGSGSGPGGGGGGGGGGIGSEAKLLGGNRARLPSRLLRAIPESRGYAHLLLSVGADGKVGGCDVLTSSRYPSVDQALCDVMIRNSRWQPARDRQGRPIGVKVRYTATWSKD